MQARTIAGIYRQSDIDLFIQTQIAFHMRQSALDQPRVLLLQIPHQVLMRIQSHQRLWHDFAVHAVQTYVL